MATTEIPAVVRSTLKQKRDEQLVTLEWFVRSEEVTPGFVSELAIIGKEFNFRLKVRVLKNNWRHLCLKRLPT
jgi:hypothetical protein